MEMAPVSDEAQKRLTVTAGTESGKPAASAPQRAMSPMPSCAVLTQPAVMSLDPIERDTDPLARRHHCLAQQIIGAQVGQRPVATDRGSHSAEDEGVAHW